MTELFPLPDTLVPAIAQDASSGRVLMMAWMNRDAWQETVDTGYATYFSRSRQRLWRKGEESGHRQRVLSIHVDCDADTILLQVEQTGAACHTGYQSCFYRRYQPSSTTNNSTTTSSSPHHPWVIDETPLVNPDDVYHESNPSILP